MAHSHDIANALADAFSEDPLFSCFFPDDERRRKVSFYTFRLLANYAVRNGIVNTESLDGGVCGVAVWLPSETLNRRFIDEVRYGGISMLRHQGVGAVIRQMRASYQMNKIHTSLISVPHYYLSLLGVKKTAQGHGFATKLLAPMLTQADEEGRPCYLDTHNEEILSLYRRFGFQVIYEGKMLNTLVGHWVMIRYPESRESLNNSEVP